jgi:hypothetical protein
VCVCLWVCSGMGAGMLNALHWIKLEHSTAKLGAVSSWTPAASQCCAAPCLLCFVALTSPPCFCCIPSPQELEAIGAGPELDRLVAELDMKNSSSSSSSDSSSSSTSS